MVQAKFSNLRWQKGTSYLAQGIKGNATPYNAVGGGNGSFVCVTPSYLQLDLLTDDGYIYTKEIIRVVKNANGWQKLSNKRIYELEYKLKNSTFWIHQGEILNLEQMVRV